MSGPTWLCHCVGRCALTVEAPSVVLAIAQCKRRGYEVETRLGRPRVKLAGYSSDPRPAMPKGLAARRRQREAQEPAPRSYLVRHALELRDEIRHGFPLRTSGSQRQCSDWQLRDFAADVGALLERCDPDEELEAALKGDDAAGLGAALVCALILIDAGYGMDDALAVANRDRRVSVPRV